MAGYILKRMLQIVLILIVFQSILFFLLQAQPGGIEYQFIANPDIPPEARQVIVERLGLDRPLGEQYLNYLKNFFTGNLGVSFTLYPRPVIDVIAERAPRTVLLFLTATVVSFYTGFVLGKILAWQRGGLLEYGVTLGGSFLYTVFTPWFALLLIWITFALAPLGRPLVGDTVREPAAILDADTPLGLTQWLQENPTTAQMFNPQWWGDWLAWDGPPGIRPKYVSARSNTCPAFTSPTTARVKLLGM